MTQKYKLFPSQKVTIGQQFLSDWEFKWKYKSKGWPIEKSDFLITFDNSINPSKLKYIKSTSGMSLDFFDFDSNKITLFVEGKMVAWRDYSAFDHLAVNSHFHHFFFIKAITLSPHANNNTRASGQFTEISKEFELAFPFIESPCTDYSNFLSKAEQLSLQLTSNDLGKNLLSRISFDGLRSTSKALDGTIYNINPGYGIHVDYCTVCNSHYFYSIADRSNVKEIHFYVPNVEDVYFFLLVMNSGATDFFYENRFS